MKGVFSEEDQLLLEDVNFIHEFILAARVVLRFFLEIFHLLPHLLHVLAIGFDKLCFIELDYPLDLLIDATCIVHQLIMRLFDELLIGFPVGEFADPLLGSNY